MGSASFCPMCGEIIGGWQEDELTLCACDEERERMSDVDQLLEQFDFAIDAVVEVRNYIANIEAFLASVPLLLESLHDAQVQCMHQTWCTFVCPVVYWTKNCGDSQVLPN